MTDYLASHLDLNPLALAAFGLCAVILACWAAEPWWTKRCRHARVTAERHARVTEDEAWAHREEHAEVASRLRWERHVAAMDMGGHSVAVSVREEFDFSGLAGGGS